LLWKLHDEQNVKTLIKDKICVMIFLLSQLWWDKSPVKEVEADVFKKPIVFVTVGLPQGHAGHLLEAGTYPVPLVWGRWCLRAARWNFQWELIHRF
jgi:hypothetical protein